MSSTSNPYQSPVATDPPPPLTRRPWGVTTLLLTLLIPTVLCAGAVGMMLGQGIGLVLAGEQGRQAIGMLLGIVAMAAVVWRFVRALTILLRREPALARKCISDDEAP
jgi:hypothetical protein